MIDLNDLISETFETIERVIPDAVVKGRLVKYDKVYNRDTLKYEQIEVDRQDIKCVFDTIEESFRTAEHSDTIISKIHVFGLLEKPVEMFDEMSIGYYVQDWYSFFFDPYPTAFKTDKLKQINVGTSTVLHTFLITR